MTSLLLKTAVKTLFTVTSRRRTMIQTRAILDKYNRLAARLTESDGRRQVEVPPLPGVDEDMRRWSFYMILEHNTIVNRGIGATVEQLVRGDPLHGDALINPKTDVMPSASAGPEQLKMFRDSVTHHMARVETFGRLRGTRTAPHVIFGDFDAHKWNCMFSFHLGLHYRQAAHLARRMIA